MEPEAQRLQVLILAGPTFTSPLPLEASQADVVRVDTIPDFRQELPLRSWDVILADPALLQVLDPGRMESLLRRSSSLLRATLDSTVNGILVIDRAGKVVECNKRFIEMWRMDPAVIAEGDDEKLLPYAISQLRDPDQFMGKVMHLYQNPELDSHDFLNFSDGRTFERWSLPQWLDGEVVGRVWSFLDITDRKRLEADFLQAQKMEAVGRLAGGVAHDFNNLLTAVIGYSDLLLMRLPESNSQRREVTEIRRAAERGAALTKQLLAFSRRQVIESQVVDLNALVTRMADLLRRVIGDDVELVLDLRQQLGRVRVDPAQVEQALMNLAVNARDAMASGGSLTLTTGNMEVDAARSARLEGLATGTYVTLTISDTGAGMDEATRARIFEPFYTTKGPGQGTGLGLSMVHGMVHQSGGSIEVTSSLGRGTSFRLYFPRVESPASDPPAPERSVPAGARGKTEGRILLAEDETPLRALIHEVLETQGFEVLAADSGRQALSKARELLDPMDLLITDVIMHDIGGLELARELRVRWPGLPVLYISGYTGDSVAQLRSLEQGTNFLQKPFGPDELCRRVREILEARAAQLPPSP